MTLIVYRDGILAGDTGQWIGTTMVSTISKVHITPDGSLFGCAGDYGNILRFESWMFAGAPDPMPKMKHLDAIVVTPKGVVLRFFDDGSSYPIKAKYSVIGCCSDFARGSLAAGASAEEAVQLAIEQQAYVGGKMESVRLLSVPIKRKSTLRNARRA
jgi:hypothetical protein